MSVEVNESVEPEVQEASSQPAEAVQQQVAPESEQPKQRRKNDAEHNWAEARRKMQELELQNKEMQQQLQSLRRPQETVEKDLESFQDDDILTAAQAKKMAENLARKVAEDVIKKREAATVDERLMLKHPDFANVVTRENIEFLKETEPEFALSLTHIPDPYQQGVAAYKMLKKLGIYKESESIPEKEKAQKNSQKPVSVNAVTKNSAIGNAHLFENGLTPELKKQLYQEMRQAAKKTG